LVAGASFFGSGRRIFRGCNGGVPDKKGSAMLTTRKIVADFSFAAVAAALIGVAVGGTALSFVWLLAVLSR
jgi:hypothetical protein